MRKARASNPVRRRLSRAFARASPRACARALISEPGLLGALVALAAAAIFALSMIRSADYFTAAYDLGAYQQILWTGAHGGTFFDAPDSELVFVPNIFWIHPAPLLVLLAPLYAAAPKPATLFLLQSLAIALAAIPLYAISKHIGVPGRWALVPSLLLIVWVPTLSGALFDFHLESFLPVGLLTAFALWQRQRYLWGLVAAVFVFSTLEVGPVYVVFLAIYFLLPSGTGPTGSSGSKAGASRQSTTSRISTFVRGYGRFLVQREALWSAGLLAGSVGAFLLLRAWQSGALLASLGHPVPPGVPGAPVAYTGWTGGSLGLSISALGQGFSDRLEYWLVAYALVGFLPFLAPRALLLTIPSWLLSFLYYEPSTFATFGTQHGLLNVFPVFVGVALGMVRLVPALRPLEPSVPTARYGPPVLPSRAKPWVVGALVLLVATNMALSPANPWPQEPTNGNGGYSISYSIPPGGAELQQLAGLVSPDADVLASDNLFPLVANDPSAYTLLWYPANPPFLPFNSSHLPTYVLLAQNEVGDSPDWLVHSLYDGSTYRLRGVAWSTPVGTGLLFERSWTGPTATWGTPPRGGSYAADAFWLGPAAQLPSGGSIGAQAPSGTSAIVSQGGVQGVVWYGPYESLAPGNYSASVKLKVSEWGGAPVNTSRSVLELEIGAWGFGDWVDRWFSVADLKDRAMTVLNVSFEVTQPAVDVEVRGIQTSTTSVVTLYSTDIVGDNPPV